MLISHVIATARPRPRVLIPEVRILKTFAPRDAHKRHPPAWQLLQTANPSARSAATVRELSALLFRRFQRRERTKVLQDQHQRARIRSLIRRPVLAPIRNLREVALQPLRKAVAAEA